MFEAKDNVSLCDISSRILNSHNVVFSVVEGEEGSSALESDVSQSSSSSAQQNTQSIGERRLTTSYPAFMHIGSKNSPDSDSNNRSKMDYLGKQTVDELRTYKEHGKIRSHCSTSARRQAKESRKRSYYKNIAKEIKKYRKLTNCLIPKNSFKQLVQEILRGYQKGNNFRFQKDAVSALQQVNFFAKLE